MGHKFDSVFCWCVLISEPSGTPNLTKKTQPGGTQEPHHKKNSNRSNHQKNVLWEQTWNQSNLPPLEAPKVAPLLGAPKPELDALPGNDLLVPRGFPNMFENHAAAQSIATNLIHVCICALLPPNRVVLLDVPAKDQFDSETV